MIINKYILPVMVLVSSTFLCGCSLAGLHQAANRSREVQAITSPIPPSGSMAHNQVVETYRPAAQAVGQTLPDGQLILGLFSGLAGLIFGGIQLAIKSRRVTQHQVAVAALSSLIPPDSNKALPPSIRKTIAESQEYVRKVTS